MSRPLRLPLLVAVILAAAGCATPRYETTHRYEPPAGAEGQACVKGCEAALSACRKDCEAAWQACIQTVEPQVDEAYAKALEAYADDLRHYRRMLDHYQFDRWMDWDFGYRGLWYSPWPHHPWTLYAPLPIPPGELPGKEAVRNGLRKAQCKDDCGCQPKYDACYVGCGGRVETETRCVADCPGGK